MKEINYNSALTPSSLSIIPFLFLGSVNIHKNEININTSAVSPNFELKSESNGSEVFDSLQNLNIQLEPSQKDILINFISKISSESKDLEGEIVDMVNRKFEKLLLKI